RRGCDTPVDLAGRARGSVPRRRLCRMIRAVIVAPGASGPMLAEARRSWRNERTLRALGAIEPPRDVYRAMQIAYPACFVVMAAEAVGRGVPLGQSFAS